MNNLLKTILKPFLYLFMCLVIIATYATKALEDCYNLIKKHYFK